MAIRITDNRVVHDTDSTLEICAKDIRASEVSPRIGRRKTVAIQQVKSGG